MRDLFGQWYSDCITAQLAQGIDIDNINVDCGLKPLKPFMLIGSLALTTF